jgi:hypothetical protein
MSAMGLFYDRGILSAAGVDFTVLKCHRSENKKARAFAAGF